MARTKKYSPWSTEIKAFQTFSDYIVQDALGKETTREYQEGPFTPSGLPLILKDAFRPGRKGAMEWDSFSLFEHYTTSNKLHSLPSARYWFMALSYMTRDKFGVAADVTGVLEALATVDLSTALSDSQIVDALRRISPHSTYHADSMGGLLRRQVGGAKALDYAMQAWGDQLHEAHHYFFEGLKLPNGYVDRVDDEAFLNRVRLFVPSYLKNDDTSVRAVLGLLENTKDPALIQEVFEKSGDRIQQMPESIVYRYVRLLSRCNDKSLMGKYINQFTSMRIPEKSIVWLAVNGDFPSIAKVVERIITDQPDCLKELHSIELVLAMVQSYKKMVSTKDTRGADYALFWLCNEGANAIAGLFDLVVSEREKDTALVVLNKIKAAGGGYLIESMLAKRPSNDQQVLMKALGLSSEPAPSVSQAAAGLPSWCSDPKLVATTDDKLDPAHQPKLRLLSGDVVPTTAVCAYLNLVKTADPYAKKPSADWPKLQQFIAQCDPASVDLLHASLLERYLTMGATKEYKWLLRIFALGFGIQSAETLLDNRHSRGANYTIALKDVFKGLARLQSPEAIWYLNQFTTGGRRSVRTNAEIQLAEIAASKKVAVDELLEEFTPRCGFDSNCQQQIAIGDKTYTVQLRGIADLLLRDDTNKPIVALPTTRQSAEASKAREQYKTLVESVRKIQTEEAYRLEQAMITGRRWQASRWKQLFLNNPLLRALAQTIVWGVTKTNDVAEECHDSFMLLDDGSFMHADYSPFAINDSSYVCVVHPLDLSTELRTAWVKVLSEGKILACFDQLGRPTYEALSSDDNPVQDVKLQFPDAILDKRGWQQITEAYNKKFVPTAVWVEIEFASDYSPSFHFKLRRINAYLPEGFRKDRVGWGSIPKRIRSEIFLDLSLLQPVKT